jgi:hypothetical protein
MSLKEALTWLALLQAEIEWEKDLHYLVALNVAMTELKKRIGEGDTSNDDTKST